MLLVVVNKMSKLELVIALRKIAATEYCELSIRAASKITDWTKDGTAYDITSYLKQQEEASIRRHKQAMLTVRRGKQ